MQSRMDKYNSSDIAYKSRTQKNQDLYEDVKTSSLKDFDVNSNFSVIDADADSIDISKLGKILDEKYNEYTPKRRSIEVPAYEEEPIVSQPLVDTKEYDINAILQKAKQGKNVDYNKERLKKVREAQYEILNNLDLELKKVEDAKKNSERKAEEDNLMNLINTITQLEIKNKEESKKKDNDSSLSLFSDLIEESNTEDQEEKLPPMSDVTQTQKEIRLVVIDPEKAKEIEKENEEKNSENKEENREEKVEKTLSKLNIDLSSYDDFSDISKQDTGTIIIKIIIFIIIIALVVGAVYILNVLLNLGLF
jgi:hypothetical protein